MLRAHTEQNYKKYADFVYEPAIDQSKSVYPTYSDGIQTKEMLLSHSRQA